VKDPGIKLILDTSAVLAYAAGSIDLGETIAEVVDEGGRFGASAVCLAEGVRLVDDAQTLGVPLLTRHPRFVSLPLLGEDWDRVGYWARELGRVERAAAVVEVLDRPDGYLVTAEPGRYDIKPLDDLPIIGV
jgi:glycine/D-amino acid oxidase-like deaminating enzyme